MDTDIHEGLRTDFEKLTLKEKEWQHNLKELAENTFSVCTPAVAGPGGMPAVAVPGAPLVGGPCKTAVAGHGMPLPAMLQASIILLASVRGEGAAAHGMVMHQADSAGASSSSGVEFADDDLRKLVVEQLQREIDEYNKKIVRLEAGMYELKATGSIEKIQGATGYFDEAIKTYMEELAELQDKLAELQDKQ
jgi:hypothetical protein